MHPWERGPSSRTSASGAALDREPAVERFDTAFWDGVAFDQRRAYTAWMRPVQHGSAADLAGHYPCAAPDGWPSDWAPGGHRGSTGLRPRATSGDDRRSLRSWHHRQSSPLPRVHRAVRPNTKSATTRRWVPAGAPGGRRPVATGISSNVVSASDLQLGFGVQPLDAFVVHPMTRLPQLQIDHPGPVATVAVSEARQCAAGVSGFCPAPADTAATTHSCPPPRARVAHSDRARSYAAPAFDELVRLPLFS